MVEGTNPVGRPKLFKSKDEIEGRIKEYFFNCDEKDTPYTVSGLSYSLGMSRQTLLEYENNYEEFLDTVKDAKRKIEASIEERCMSNKTNATFGIFNLTNNFSWSNVMHNKTEVKGGLPVVINVAKTTKKQDE